MKTTLMQNILKQEKRKIALIVNDIGSINIDASILNKSEHEVVQVEMVEMQNGCICCTLRDEFMNEIERLAADRIYREFLHDLMSEEESDDGDVINLVMDQIEFCNFMVLNKTDLPTEKELEEVKTGLRQLQHKAEMITSTYGDVDLDVILNAGDFDYDEVEAYSSVQTALNNCEHDDEKACVDEYGISSFVFEEKRPFNREAFCKPVNSYPQSLIRSKGYIWFSDDWDHVQLFEQAGRNASITEMSEWVSSWPEEELALIIKVFPDLKDDWDEVYGDRCNQVWIQSSVNKTIK